MQENNLLNVKISSFAAQNLASLYLRFFSPPSESRKFTWTGKKGINSVRREHFSNSWKRSVPVERSQEKKLKDIEVEGFKYKHKSELTKISHRPQISHNQLDEYLTKRYSVNRLPRN